MDIKKSHTDQNDPFVALGLITDKIQMDLTGKTGLLGLHLEAFDYLLNINPTHTRSKLTGFLRRPIPIPVCTQPAISESHIQVGHMNRMGGGKS